MAKPKTVFFCKECGYESPKWMGQCPACKEWNTFVEEPVQKREIKGTALSGAKRGTPAAKPAFLNEISLEEKDRISTGFEELDRVLGDGIVIGSLVLVGGDPGIGKSTLLLQMCRNLASSGRQVLYISGEESLKQIKIRANRIGEVTGSLKFLCETSLDIIEEVIREEKPEIVLIPWKRQPGKRVHKRADADRQRAWYRCFHCRPCDKRGSGRRTQSAGAYGRYGVVF